MSSQLDYSTGPGDRPAAADTFQIIQGASLFVGLPATELEELVRVMQPIERSANELLWRQGQVADGLHLIIEGNVAVSLRQPGGEELRIATLAPGDVVGEVPLLDGGTRSASARAESAVRLLFLSRADFDALTMRRHPTALTVRRRILSLVCARLRRAYDELGATLEGSSADTPPSSAPVTAEVGARPPAMDYLRRLAFFKSFDEAGLAELLARSQLALVRRGRTLVAEGELPQAFYVTLNGAVEEAIERRRQRIPVGLAGPGRAFGYIGLIDGLPSALTATARERALVLVVPGPLFQEHFQGTSPASYAFFGGVERDLMAALRRKDLGFVRAVRQG